MIGALIIYLWLIWSIACRVMVQTFTQMTSIMKENGTLIKEADGDVCTTKMEQYMRASGMTTREMAKACSD